LLSTLAFVTSAALLGGMLYFALGFAPLVFTRLPAETAARFIRAVFPVYYAMGAGTALLATLLLLPTGRWAALALAGAVAAGFLVARSVLMPAVNAARDQGLAGDAAANRRFARLHGGSVALNGAQALALVGLLVLLAKD
jgi:hypothetical protein